MSRPRHCPFVHNKFFTITGVHTKQIVYRRYSTVICVQPLMSRPSKLYTAGLPLSFVSNPYVPDQASCTQQVFHYHLCPTPHVQTQQVVHNRSSTITCVQPPMSRPGTVQLFCTAEFPSLMSDISRQDTVQLSTARFPSSLVSDPSCPGTVKLYTWLDRTSHNSCPDPDTAQLYTWLDRIPQDSCPGTNAVQLSRSFSADNYT